MLISNNTISIFELFLDGRGHLFTSEMFPSYTTNEWSYTHQGVDEILYTSQGYHEVSAGGILLHTTSAGTTEYWVYTLTTLVRWRLHSRAVL